MISIASSRSYLLLFVVWLVLAGGCARLPDTRVTPIPFKPATLGDLQEYLFNHKADLEQFRLRGPFEVTMQRDLVLRLSSTERIRVNLFLASPAEKAPLVIFLHGHDSSKEAHAYQAIHAASWGMHSLTVQLPKKGPWDRNGRMLKKIVDTIFNSPEIIDRRIDVNKIILVGHSFGGYAVTVALAEGARAAGGILLDPAVVGNKKPTFLQKINKPVMLLGADENVSAVRHRNYFFHYIRSGIAEISIKDASHEDAQYPSEFALQNFGFDPETTEALQITFASAITSVAFSLSTTRTFDYAWKSFGDVFENGKFYNAKKK